MSEVDTSAEAVERALSALWKNPKAVPEFVDVQEIVRALMAERDAAHAAGRKEALEEALREIADGYGPNHLSKFARDKARAALAKPDQP